MKGRELCEVHAVDEPFDSESDGTGSQVVMGPSSAPRPPKDQLPSPDKLSLPLPNDVCYVIICTTQYCGIRIQTARPESQSVHKKRRLAAH